MTGTFRGALGARGARGTHIVKELAPRALGLNDGKYRFYKQPITPATSYFLHVNLH
jgi:hypothetical protein